MNIHGIKTMPAGYDAEVAELFRDLRSATALSEMDLAARLGTRPEVVQSLEQGALFALPAWPETCRVVNAYGALLNLDVRPLLRRIYAQLEAGIVELQPKAIPDVPVMAPPDFGAGTSASRGNNAMGGHAANPLDIPWPPQSPAPQAPPNVWPQGAPAPQMPWPHQQPTPQPQHTWPGMQPQQQAWPGNQPMPQQAPRPSAPPQYPAAAPQPHPRQPRPQSQPRPQAQPQPQPQAQPMPAPEPDIASHPLATDFTAELAPPPAEPEKKRGRPALLKWGLGALIVSAVAFGLWFALSQVPAPSSGPGAGQTQNGQLDPDDPRSRKADRLPDAFQTPPQ